MGNGFFARVYEVVSQVPPGRVITYGRIAALLGNPHAAQAVGWAMRVCPDDIPGHRVVPATGSLKLGLFGSPGRWREVLVAEGVAMLENGCVDIMAALWP